MTKVHLFHSLLATAAAGLVVLAASTSAEAAELRGTLQGVDTLQPSPAPSVPNHRLFYWEDPNGAIDLRRPHANPETDIAVVVTGATVDETRQPVRLPVAGGRCRPGTAVVAVNGVLDVQNQDWFPHEFYAVAPDQTNPIESFRPELTAPRSNRQVQIAQGGTYVLRDRLSPLFRCWIVVGPGQGRMVTAAADNSFRVPNVVDGEYNLKVYYEGRVLGEANARVSNNHDATVPAINVAAAAGAGAQGGGQGGGQGGAAGGGSGAGAATPPANGGESGGGRRRRGGH